MNLPSFEELNLLHSSVCQAVGDPKRLQILYALSESPCYVTALAEALNTPQPTISRHLAILKQRGIVKAERDGATVVYHLADRRIISVLDLMRQMLREIISEQSNTIES